MESIVYGNIIGLVADAIGDVTCNDETDIRRQIEAGKTNELVQRIQNKMLEYGVKADDVYAENTVSEIKTKLTWMIEHPYTAPTDEQISKMVGKLVNEITRPYKGHCMLAKR